MMEYQRISVAIDKEWLSECIPECWTAFVSLKVEYYKGMSKYLIYTNMTDMLEKILNHFTQ